MPTATVTSKGQVTIPKEIRDRLHLRSGDSVDFVVEDGGRVVLKQATLDVAALEGALARPGRTPVSVEEMHRVIHKRAGRRT